MGGTDDPSNLVELTIEEHAEAHRILFEEFGHWQDYLAWQGLSKMIPREELIKRVQSEASKERLRIKGNPWSGIRTKFNFSENPDFQKRVTEKAQTPEAKRKRKESFAKIGHQQGSKNSQYGTCWVTHKEFGNKQIKKELLAQHLEKGYIRGRVMKFVEV